MDLILRFIRLYVAASVVLIGAKAYAQPVQVNVDSVSSVRINNPKHTVWAEYHPGQIWYKGKNTKSQPFTGFSLGYSYAFHLLRSQHWMGGAGLGMQFWHYSNRYRDYVDNDGVVLFETKFKMLSAKIPVNLSYKIDFSRVRLSVLPYLGITVRYNIDGRFTKSYRGFFSEEQKFSPFNANDMGSLVATWNRWQTDWHVGAKVCYRDHFLVGVSYGRDLARIALKTYINTTTVSFAYVF